MDEEYILNILTHYISVVERERSNTVFGVFLKGSQNYNLDTEESDIDAVALLIPTKDMLISNLKLNPHSITSQYGIISVMDIRDFGKGLLNGNPQMLEILNTNFYIIKNNSYHIKWINLKLFSCDFEYIDPRRTLESLKGQAKSYYNNFKKSKEIDGKNLMHLVRLNNLIGDYCSDYDYRKKSFASKMKNPSELTSLRNVEKTKNINSYADSLLEHLMTFSLKFLYPIDYDTPSREIDNFILDLIREELKIK